MVILRAIKRKKPRPEITLFSLTASIIASYRLILGFTRLRPLPVMGFKHDICFEVNLNKQKIDEKMYAVQIKRSADNPHLNSVFIMTAKDF